MAIAGVFLAGGAVLSAPPVVAAATPPLRVGLGVFSPDRTDFVGFYKAQVDGRWRKVYCIRPDAAEPAEISLRTVTRLPNTSRAVTRQLAETLTAHGNPRTVVQAAAVSQALNEEVGNHRAVRRRAQWLPDPVQVLTDKYLAEARALAGPVRLSIDLPHSPLPGRSARGKVTLSTVNGPVRGTVELNHTPNVTTPDEVRTGRFGNARFAYETVAGGPVRIVATARVVPTTVRASSPGSGEQLMVSWSAPVKVRASATYEATGPGITYRYACTSECDGHPVVTLGGCAPANRYESALTFSLGEDVSRRLHFRAATTRECKSIQVALADGTQVSAVWQYRSPRGWTRKVPAAGSFVVDCPAAPPVAVAVSYTCTQARISATLGTQLDGTLRRLANRTTHRMVLVVSGAVRGRYVVAPGTRADVHTFLVPCGDNATVTFRSGVQRTSGAYNYGDPVTVALP